MKKYVILKTNLFVCMVIIIGFIITSLISYHSNQGLFQRETENVSGLTSEGICHRIDTIFAKPINVSLTMANDSLLKDFLAGEEENQGNRGFIKTMQDYLLAYKEKYGYDSVFLVSTKTNRYYTFNGVDRTLFPDNPENVWYFTQLDSPLEYSLNIDNDEVATADNDITIFINCKIRDASGELVGIVGVGFRVNYIQAIFREYEEKYKIKAYLTDQDGTIQISTDRTGYERQELFAGSEYPQLKDETLGYEEGTRSFWYGDQGRKGYLVSQYIPNLDWYLIVENDITAAQARLRQELLIGIVVIILVILAVLVTITNIIRKYNRQIVRLTMEEEEKHRIIFRQETEKIYENIYEVDITHNRAASEETEAYFKSLGVPEDTPFDKALSIIAEKQIKEEFRQSYISTFSPENILSAYERGQESLRCDFMISNDGGESYYWMRITARIFFWDEDKSVRIFVYRQNVSEEKNREKGLLEKMEQDSLTGLYNKASTQYHIQNALMKGAGNSYAFLILDIDNFKQVNDNCGHDFGDKVIADFARRLRAQFRQDDIVGRIGGDEFVVFVQSVSREWLACKIQSLVQNLHYEFADDTKKWEISASLGAALAPEAGTTFEELYRNADGALYDIKQKGKNGYTFFQGGAGG